jgi:hypothetical protein
VVTVPVSSEIASKELPGLSKRGVLSVILSSSARLSNTANIFAQVPSSKSAIGRLMSYQLPVTSYQRSRSINSRYHQLQRVVKEGQLAISWLTAYCLHDSVFLHDVMILVVLVPCRGGGSEVKQCKAPIDFLSHQCNGSLILIDD